MFAASQDAGWSAVSRADTLPGEAVSGLRRYKQARSLPMPSPTRQLDVERAHIVGHDWGGAVAWGLGSTRTGSVLSLTVLSTPYRAR